MAEGDNLGQPDEQAWQFQPGETIAPGQAQPSPPPSPPADSTPLPPSVDSSTTPTPEPKQAPEALTPQAVAVPPEGSEGSISWTASEFISHQKSAGWYVMLALATAIVAGLVWLLTKGLVSVAVIVFGAILLGIYGARQPRQLRYQLDEGGLSIGEKYYSYTDFRSFAILPEGAFASIVFMPLKRFMPLTTIYYAPEDEAKIVALLSARLPLEERRHDPVDRFMNRIHF